ncbi:amino acid ABC transporter substrate-binding protein [Bifidobacterium aemilianum]|uniref:Amino acid ABC transporter substrate-binding protein n=1 Tax=Bifidobacterium aemilianum TaxID=2493120 RepID=A0A366K767_9BIFI|nr:ABC transporter substrate-binding protein [Bifidobacterium aemilianum]RBP97529.1 amino acid ABC transporter substrate-binding protein [Bifidobacterium aemilianum]
MVISGKNKVIRLIAAAVSLVALATSAGCGAGTADAGKSDDIKQQTINPGKLTIATGQPAYAPYVIDNKPESGKGFESAVAYAVAEKMGFSKSDVTWTRTTFDAAIAPGSKDYDLNIQQFSMTPERKTAVDFTPSYYNPTQSVIVRKDSKYASAKTLADLKDASVAAMVGTTSYDFAKSKIKDDIKTFNDNVALSQALDSNQVDAIVDDTPTAVYVIEDNQVKNAKVLGQIGGSEDPEGMGIVLPKDSKLTKAASKAVSDMTKDGSLKKLQDTWLKEYTTDIPTLK